METGRDGERQPSLKRRHVAAVMLGNGLEFYDFLTYSFFAIQIGHAFFPARGAFDSLMLSLATFGVGFLARPFGGFVIGIFADRAGRRPAMLLSFLLIGVSTAAMALIPTYAEIGMAAPVLAILARIVQGFSLGGEIGSNTAFLLEAAPPATRGFSVAWQGASQCAALLAASLVGIALTRFLPPALLDAWGWRIAFLIGAVTVPFGLWLRSHLPETLHMAETQPAERAATGFELAARHWRIMLLGLVALGMATIANYINIYAVTYAQDILHLSLRTGFIAETVNNLIAIPSGLLGAWISDRHGRWPVNVWTNLGLLVAGWPLFAWMVSAHSDVSLIVSMTILGVAANFSFGSLLAALSESLPKSIRVTGLATVYSLAIGVLGGSTPFIVHGLIRLTGNAIAPAWYMTGATLIGQVALMLIPESAPARLRRNSPFASAAA
ncbi:MAG TPA: MFS transporter [Rhizomicrobium sp.]|jgi:MFS family permease|nr:MFS transporter [Rhizomicrobium sp.]